MPLKLEIISEHREIVGDDAVREFRAEGGTIGRSLNNDWILPDPDKFISGKHATIDCKGGIYYIVDISTNGVYVNDERKPIGKGKPRRLFNGDHLHFGDFEILASIDEGEDLEMPADPKPTVVPDHIEQLVEEDRIKTGVQLLDEDEITGDIAFESILYADR
jgi:type VI secretion system FHA domain protein